MPHKPQPGLFKQVFGDIALVRQSGEKVVQAAVECVVHRIERRGIARSQAADELELKLAIHRGNNAEDRHNVTASRCLLLGVISGKTLFQEVVSWRF